MPSAFEATNLQKSYGRRRVLDIDRLCLDAGGITALVGPNGSGKSTLLECLNGLTRPDEGDIRFFGGPVTREARRRMTMVFQTPRLFHGTVAYNVAYGARLRSNRGPETVAGALKAVCLQGFEKRSAQRLSGGEIKRVAIARALAVAPDALLLDEPTANIDVENTAVIEDAIRCLCDTRGLTVILTTHSHEQAARLSHRVLLLDKGRLAPWFPENRFQATLMAAGNEKILLIGDKPLAAVITDAPPGAVACVIPIDEISVSGKPVETPGQNCWPGTVSAVAQENAGVRVTVNAGVPITARISNESYQELRPALGDTLYLSFKASSIQVF